MEKKTKKSIFSLDPAKEYVNDGLKKWKLD